MVGAPATAASAASDLSEAGERHLVLYDGVCALCNGLVQFLLVRDRRRVLRFASLQSAIGQAIVKSAGDHPEELNSLYVVQNYGTARAGALTRSRAALFVVGELGWPWRLVRIAGVLPTVILDRAYDAVARTRYRIFGRYEQCLAPRPEFRDRFVD
jgi:predicted DCC family thiol-disulfide oxidoreductase YuxK